MLMVPTLVPVLVPVGAAAAAGLEGVAALLVWANAEIVRITALARKSRKNLLVIGSVVLLGTCCLNMLPGMNYALGLRSLLP
jgi:hypothetical protein